MTNPTHKIVNGKQIILTQEEITEIQTEWQINNDRRIVEQQKEAAAKTKKESVLTAATGKTIDQLSQKEKDNLLVVLLMQLGFADENGKIILP